MAEEDGFSLFPGGDMATTRGPKTAYLTIDSLKLLSDGMLGPIVNEELDKLVKDIDDRGDDRKPRKLTIELTLLPDKSGLVAIDAQVKASVPAHRPGTTIAKLNKGRDAILFNPEVAASPDQMTIEIDEQTTTEG